MTELQRLMMKVYEEDQMDKARRAMKQHAYQRSRAEAESSLADMISRGTGVEHPKRSLWEKATDEKEMTSVGETPFSHNFHIPAIGRFLSGNF